MLKSFTNQKGISLIELQIAAVISLVIGGISFFTLFRSQSAYSVGEKMADLNFRGRQSMDRLVEEIRLAGFGQTIGDTAFLSAKNDELTMLADLKNDGIVDTIRFYLSSPSSLPETQNPHDGNLYRSVNGSTPGTRIGSSFTKLTFGYFDEDGEDLLVPTGPVSLVPSSDLNRIRLITISLKAEMQKPDRDGHYRGFALNSSANPRNVVILAME